MLIEEVSPAPPTTVFGVALSRFIWLSGLLLLQSLSSIVLEWHRELIQKHIVVTLFLTMLVCFLLVVFCVVCLSSIQQVGAGGNAGAQAAVNVVRAIAVKKIVNRRQALEMLSQEAMVGILLASGLFFVGFSRVLLTRGLDAVREVGGRDFLS